MHIQNQNVKAPEQQELLQKKEKGIMIIIKQKSPMKPRGIMLTVDSYMRWHKIRIIAAAIMEGEVTKWKPSAAATDTVSYSTSFVRGSEPLPTSATPLWAWCSPPQSRTNSIRSDCANSRASGCERLHGGSIF